MLPRRFIFLSVLFLAILGLPACDTLLGPEPNPPLGIQTLAPAVATATLMPTPNPPMPTSADIPAVTVPAVAPSPVPTVARVIPTLTPVTVQPTAVPPVLPLGEGTCSYKATFLGDVTIPDNTVVPAGSAFVKTWRLRNDGTCSWGTAGFALHSLVFVGGSPLGAPNPVPLPVSEVRQGSIVDVSIPMVAPTVAGTYRSNWMLQVDNSRRIGVGPRGSTALYAQIVVGAPATGTDVTPIKFTPGATNAAVDGTLPAGQIQDFSVSALQGQTMMLTLSSASPNVSMSVSGAQGINPQTLRASPDGTFWLGLLPATEDYIVHVSAAGQSANFTLLVTIPQRITFTPGTIAAVTSGATTGRRTVTYLLKASAGQRMTVNLDAPPSTVGLTIYGLNDGIPLVRAVSGATTWTGQLPGTQDYVIEVVPAVDDTINFAVRTMVQ